MSVYQVRTGTPAAVATCQVTLAGRARVKERSETRGVVPLPAGEIQAGAAATALRAVAKTTGTLTVGLTLPAASWAARSTTYCPSGASAPLALRPTR